MCLYIFSIYTYGWVCLLLFYHAYTDTHIHFTLNGSLYCQWEKYGLMVESKNLQFDHFSKFVVLLSYLRILLDSGQKCTLYSNARSSNRPVFHSASSGFSCMHFAQNTRAHCLHWWYNLYTCCMIHTQHTSNNNSDNVYNVHIIIVVGVLFFASLRQFLVQFEIDFRFSPWKKH